MMDWWLRLEARERGLVAVAVILLMASLYYVGIWKTVSSDLTRQQARHQVLLEQLSWMQDAAREVANLQASGGRIASSGSLISIVDRGARANKVREAIQQINPEGDTRVRVVFQPVRFEHLVKLLGWLLERGVHVRELVLSQQDVPGQVSGRLVLFSR